MLCIVPTPLKIQKNLACHYIVTVWELTKAKGRHYIVTSMGVLRLKKLFNTFKMMYGDPGTVS